ncbi:MAG: hypothetical protein HQ523_01775 [Lentisphaerae bacterium]|nr:hypothetical protein [Lentisphaerota bacterium]
MSTESTDSYLSEIAKAELTHAAEMRNVQAECAAQVATARRVAEEVLAAVPGQLQEERRAAMAEARSEGEAQAAAVKQHARADAEHLTVALNDLTDFIVEEVFHMMLPEPRAAHDRTRGAS